MIVHVRLAMVKLVLRLVLRTFTLIFSKFVHLRLAMVKPVLRTLALLNFVLWTLLDWSLTGLLLTSSTAAALQQAHQAGICVFRCMLALTEPPRGGGEGQQGFTPIRWEVVQGEAPNPRSASEAWVRIAAHLLT